MKIANYAMLAAAAGFLAACGGSNTITEADIRDGAKVYFAYDSAEISAGARDNLLAQSLYLKNHADAQVQIAGNCDERGTTEYNLALGQRRANAAKSVIVKDGVDGKRISTVSYGKERPFALGSGEEVWKLNRNATTTLK